MQLTEPTDGTVAAHDAGAPPRMQTRQLGRLERERVAIARAGEERLDIGLHIEEIDGNAPVRRAPPLLGQAWAERKSREGVDLGELAALDAEACAVLEEPDTVLLAALVLERCAHEPGPQRNAHDGQVARDRI